MFNRHKLKRKWRRRKRQLSRPPERKGSLVSSKRFCGTNPYRDNGCAPSPLRKRFSMGMLLLMLLLLAGVFVYHPFFHVTAITVSGLQRLDKIDVLQTVQGSITYKKLGLLPAQSYLFVSPESIQRVLKEKYPIDAIAITKRFPKQLTIAIEEKISTVIFDNGKTYSYLDLGGNMVEVLREVGDDEWDIEKKITTTTLADGTVRTEEHIVRKQHRVPVDLVHAEMGLYPIIYDTQGRGQENASSSAVLDQRVVENTIRWFSLLQKQTDIPFGYVVLGDVGRHATVRTREGWGIEVNIHTDPSAQFEKLKQVLPKIQRPANVQYVDLRFADRVYWQ